MCRWRAERHCGAEYGRGSVVVEPRRDAAPAVVAARRPVRQTKGGADEQLAAPDGHDPRSLVQGAEIRRKCETDVRNVRISAPPLANLRCLELQLFSAEGMLIFAYGQLLLP